MFTLFEKSSFECKNNEDTFTINARGYVFDDFQSSCEAVKFQFHPMDMQALTISVECTKEQDKMVKYDKEFRRAVSQLSNDNGRFNITSSDIRSIYAKYESHLRDRGISIKKQKDPACYDTYRPGGNTAC
jgi:hypothetical protein